MSEIVELGERVLACVEGRLAPSELNWGEVCSAALKCNNASDAYLYRTCAELLARGGADVNEPVHNQRTALMMAGL